MDNALAMMKDFEIQAIDRSSISELASFLHQQRWREDSDSFVLNSFSEIHREVIERRLEWLLFENPAATGNAPHGFCIRDHEGLIRGITLCYPSTFVLGHERIFGLGSGSFYVEPQARTLGFYLFKKYLSLRGYSFFFATTCNAASATLWKTLGGHAISNSDVEYIVPFKIEKLLSERASGFIPSLARLFRRWRNPFVRVLARKSDMKVERCEDWEKLSYLALRHRPKDYITTDRTAELLKWRYNQQHYPANVYVFCDRSGNEGWFSLGTMVRGQSLRISGAVLLDAVWPRDKMNFSNIFPAIPPLIANSTDLLSIRPRVGVDLGSCRRWMISHKWASPTSFVIPPKGYSSSSVGSLDLVCADGDTALPILPAVAPTIASFSPLPIRERLAKVW